MSVPAVPPVELPQILSIAPLFADERVEIFIKLLSCTKTAFVSLGMKVGDFLSVISSMSGIPIDEMTSPKRCFRIVWSGKDMMEVDMNMTLSSFGIKKESTIHLVGILRGCVIWEHYAKERDREKLKFCMRDVDIEFVKKALDEYGVNHTYIKSEAGLKELLMNYAWANFTSY